MPVAFVVSAKSQTEIEPLRNAGSDHADFVPSSTVKLLEMRYGQL